MYTIYQRFELQDDAEMLLVWYDPETDHQVFCDFAAIRYPDGTVFTVADWQMESPKTPEEITDYKWRLEDTSIMAVMIDGLPRLFGVGDIRTDWSDDWQDAMDVQQAAASWGIAPRSVRDLIGRGRIPLARQVIVGGKAKWLMPPMDRPEKLKPGIEVIKRFSAKYMR